MGLEAAALKPRIDPSGDLRPQPDLYGEQGVGAELGVAQAELDELLSFVQIYRALGGGWQTS